ncbi:hypothetical protein M405DRAFT_600457 [Rhizopogon salebrosus TDB-379]|nr:hypothetical protein M405DRAFT_600457 [Rhizopogon salebrosus TDB-379]
MQRLDLSISHNPGSVSYELGTQPFQPFIPEYSTCSEGGTFSVSSARRYKHLCLPVQGGQEKVRRTWHRCSRIVKKYIHVRYLLDTHLRLGLPTMTVERCSQVCI